ncbi:hypothetical protein Aco03nite_043060 [Actinoplanes couchii]|uniref:CBM6 domain-containing protein n=1 Tax=Actinoplanes couchii TaxID=403638 RepID=A0ABQ3XBL6_9ACTN|nr:hypothetical protein Aco03nite_043060 [Actinoplanes couchii]
MWRLSGGSVLAAAPWVVIFSGVLALAVLLAVTLWATLRPDPDVARNAGGAEIFTPARPGAVASGSPAVSPPPPRPPAGDAAAGPSARGAVSPAAPAATGTTTAGASPAKSTAATTKPATAATTATATPARDAFAVIRATSSDARKGVAVMAGDEGGTALGPIGPGDWIRYDDVDFGASGPVDFVARLSSGLTGGGSGLVQIRLGSTGATPIGDFAVDNTGGWQSWRSVPGNVSRPTGVHDVYLTFTSAQPSDFVAISWFTFRH